MATTDQTVLVELIANPEVKRFMSTRSYQLNTNRWRKVGEAPPAQEPPKKNDAPPVEAKSEFIDSVPDNEPQVLLAGLRAQYEAMAGTKPNGRWNTKRLTTEIHKLENK